LAFSLRKNFSVRLRRGYIIITLATSVRRNRAFGQYIELKHRKLIWGFDYAIIQLTPSTL